jgi:hypothetical protein
MVSNNNKVGAVLVGIASLSACGGGSIAPGAVVSTQGSAQ